MKVQHVLAQIVQGRRRTPLPSRSLLYTHDRVGDVATTLGRLGCVKDVRWRSGGVRPSAKRRRFPVPVRRRCEIVVKLGADPASWWTVAKTIRKALAHARRAAVTRGGR